MSNEELIAALRYCKEHEACDHDASAECPYEHHLIDGEDCQHLLLADAADALEEAMAEIGRKNEATQGLRSELADIKDGIRETAVAIWEYEGSYADWILDIIGESNRDIDEIAEELTARTAKGEPNDNV